MKYKILFLFLVLSFYPLFSQDLSEGMAGQGLKESSSVCVPLRYGDEVKVSGQISLMDKTLSGTADDIMLTADTGRIYLLKGPLLSEIRERMENSTGPGIITVEGKIIFEGWRDRPAQVEVTSFSSSGEV